MAKLRCGDAVESLLALHMGCTATDADNWVGQTSTVILVRDPQDVVAPIVAYPGLDGAILTTATALSVRLTTATSSSG